MNKFGTQRDSSTAFEYEPEGIVPDITLTQHYESDGLFSKIIDRPAEEAMKHGYDFDGMDEDTKKLLSDVLDYIDWDESCVSALKWSRLYAGAVIVMMIDDGGDVWDPVNYSAVRGIDELRVFERAVVQPDYASMYSKAAEPDAMKHKRSNFGMPEWYYIFSQFGSFRVHESRCLVFRNGKMPERTSQSMYRFWGIPEYMRIKAKLQEADTSASYAVKLLERCVQPVYAMKGLSELLSTDDGEEKLLRRILAIDRSRGLLNSMITDAEGESYTFQSATLSGVQEIIDSTCGMLSAVTNIPQTVLFGRSPSGMNATGESDQENYIGFIERIQSTQIRRQFEKLVDLILLAMKNRGIIEEVPDFSIKFNPLKSVSEQDQATIDQQKAMTQQIKVQTLQTAIDAGVVDPSEGRRAIAQEGGWEIDTMLDDLPEEALLQMPDTPGEEPEEQISEQNPENLLQSDGESGTLKEDRKGWNTAKGGEHFLIGPDGSIQGGFGGKFTGKKPSAAFKKKTGKKPAEKPKTPKPAPAPAPVPTPKSAPTAPEPREETTPADPVSAVEKPKANQVASRIQPATSTEQAQEQAKQLGVQADYSNFDVATANVLNQALDETTQLMPAIRVGAVGAFQDIEGITTEKKLIDLESNLDKMGVPEEWREQYRDGVRISSQQRQEKMQASDAHAAYYPDTEMVFVSDRNASDYSRFEEGIKTDKILGWSSSSTPKGVIDHEIGHAISKQLGIGRMPEVQQIFDAESKKKGGIKKALSEYGASNREEFIAEAWAEYRNSNKPRPLAKKIGRIMEDEYARQHSNA
jgi:phage-related protein (TIGR01555 family)